MVEPAHPPINIIINSMVVENPPHKAKLAVPYPVPVITETALKLARRIELSQLLPDLPRSIVIRITTKIVRARNHHTCGSFIRVCQPPLVIAR